LRHRDGTQACLWFVKFMICNRVGMFITHVYLKK